jgi:DNA-binding MarR family transcriptional regulator
MPSRLEAELKQTRPFVRKTAEAMASVMRTAAVLDHVLNDALKPYRITATQYNVLRILRGAGKRGLCGREIGERLISRVPDVSRLLDRMETTGLMTRERDPDDRRHVTARASPKGLKLLVAVEPTLEGVERKRFGRLSSGALEAVIEGLAAVREAR